MRVPLVLQGDPHPGVQHAEDRAREEGVLLRVQAPDHGKNLKAIILKLIKLTNFMPIDNASNSPQLA